MASKKLFPTFSSAFLPKFSSARVRVVPNPPDSDPTQNRLLCYATDNKIGIQMLPLDGNPHRSVAVIGHASGISQVECSFDGAYVFAASGHKSSVHMWSVNNRSVSLSRRSDCFVIRILFVFDSLFRVFVIGSFAFF